VGGNWHPPNADAALRLVRSMMSAGRLCIPGLRLVVFAACPGPEPVKAQPPRASSSVPCRAPRLFLDSRNPPRSAGPPWWRHASQTPRGAWGPGIGHGIVARSFWLGHHRRRVTRPGRGRRGLREVDRDPHWRRDCSLEAGTHAREWALRNFPLEARMKGHEQLCRLLQASRAC
jgi:hypothetical protein